MTKKIILNEQDAKEISKLISLSERMGKHLTESEAKEHTKQVILENSSFDSTYYGYVSKKEYGLPVDILIDDGGFYKQQPHGRLIMFFRNGYMNENEWIPISISSDPQILSRKHIKIYPVDIYKIRVFIAQNKEGLKKLANAEVGYMDFKKNSKFINESIGGLNEMAILLPKDTGVPLRIWVDNGCTWKSAGHGPRVKIENPKGEENSFSYLPVSLPEPKLMVSDNEIQVPKNDFKLAMQFVEQNKDFLYNITVNGGSMSDVFNGITKIDKKGNAIKKNRKHEREYIKIEDLPHGYSLIKNSDDRFNILSPENTVLIKNWIDDVRGVNIIDGYLTATIAKGKERFILYIDLDDKSIFYQKLEYPQRQKR